MNFSNPMDVSSENDAPDKINAKLAANTFFSRDFFEPLTGETDLDLPVPKQFTSAEEMAKVKGVANGAKTTMELNIIIVLIVQFFISKIIKRMWPLFNII